MWNGAAAQARPVTGETRKMNTTPKGPDPSLWKREENEDAKLKRELDLCEKENRYLNEVVRHIGETVIRHVRRKE